MDSWSYDSSTLACIVDANQGRSSTAVATSNNAFRRVGTLVVTELAVPNFPCRYRVVMISLSLTKRSLMYRTSWVTRMCKLFLQCIHHLPYFPPFRVGCIQFGLICSLYTSGGKVENVAKKLRHTKPNAKSALNRDPASA